MQDCPCGLDFPYTDCCGPLIRGVSYADTAEDLMRSRYTAFAKGEWDYLEKTRYPGDPSDGETSSLFSQDGRVWTRLEIFESQKGGAFDDTGEVSFAAYYSDGGQEKILRETSKFIKENGKWYYSQAQSQTQAQAPSRDSSQPFVRKSPKVGRNDPCSCGSKKKFKKCCGKA